MLLMWTVLLHDPRHSHMLFVHATMSTSSACALQVFQELVQQMDQKQQATLQSVLAGQAPS